MSKTLPPFGFTIPQRGILFGILSLPEMVELGADADRSGAFGSLWVGDSLGAKPRPDSLTLLGALAGVTNTVTLGVGCMASFPVRDPIVFAYQWATLDVLSQGRMTVAVCTGLVKPDGASEREGAPWGIRDRDRAARMTENIEICRKLWTESSTSYRGTYTSFNDVTIEPRPVQNPPPIWIAANPSPGPFFEGALRRVAEKADGWMSVQLGPGVFGASWNALSGFLREDDRDPETFPTLAYHNINISADRQAALEETDRFLTEYYGPVFLPPMVQAWTAAGRPEDCVEQLRSLQAQGAKHITLRITSWDQRKQFDRLLGEVLPALATS